jgi:hypothetical protein
LLEEWMQGIATVFRELDEDEDRKSPVALVHHIMALSTSKYSSTSPVTRYPSDFATTSSTSSLV